MGALNVVGLYNETSDKTLNSFTKDINSILKEIDDEDYACLDNGSPAHFKCAEEETKNEKYKER